ncbi:MAG: 3-oxoadipate enol-lactonase [Steroidobacteraceae bacterium]
MQSGFVERDGCRLHYVVSGRNHAPPLLLLHPLGASLDVWAPQLPQLEPHFRVIRCDLRGHGKSELDLAPPSPRSMADFAADVLAVLDATRAPRAHWCGLSLGGQIAMWAALHYAARVRRLVLANTAAHLPPASLWEDRIATVLSAGMGPLAEAVPARWFTAGFREREPATVARIVEMLRGTTPRGYADACGALRDTDLREAIAGIALPTLVIAGAQDPSTPVEQAELLIERIAGSDLLVLDAAHLSNVEQPEDFSAAVIDFLRD